MDTARWVLGLQPKRKQLAKVPTDQVYPVHELDDTPMNRTLNLTWTLRFEDVLDVSMLESSLTRLVSRDGWRKVGGRLRQTPNGGLELHVPREFTAERPAFRLSHQTFDMCLNQHPVAKQLPKPKDHPYISAQGNKFRMFEARENMPKTPDDLCFGDEPQLSVHITSFRDETLVGLAWPHTMTSALGRQALVKAWSLTLAGRDDEVAPFEGAYDDPMQKIGMPLAPGEVGEPFALEERRLKGFSFARFAFSMIWDMYWRPWMDVRVMILPPAFVKRLREAAQKDLEIAAGDAKPPFISEGDVFAAWGSRVLARSRGNRPVTALTAVDVQSRFKSVFTPGAAYIQNTISGVYTLFDGDSPTSFGKQAHMVRQSIVEQTTEAQCEALLRLGREIQDTPLYGSPNTVLMVVTNWTKAKFFEVIDFAPAATQPDKDVPRGERTTAPGRVVYHYPNVLAPSRIVRDCLNVLGKDQDGNYWVKGEFLPECWALFEQELKAGGGR